MLDLNSVMVGTKQPQALITFYEKVLGKPPDMVDTENGFAGWQVGSAYFSVLEHSEMGGNTKDAGQVIITLSSVFILRLAFERLLKN